jgi:hypothetical protein
VPRQQNRILAFTLGGASLFVFALLMTLVFLFHYAATHHSLPGLAG